MKKDKIIEFEMKKLSSFNSCLFGKVIEIPLSKIIPKILPTLEKEIPIWHKTSVSHTDEHDITIDCFLEHLKRKYAQK